MNYCNFFCYGLAVIAGLDSERSRTMTRNLLVKCILAGDAENAELDSVSA